MAAAQKAMMKREFYSDAETYWKSVPATPNGMLGGFADLSTKDISSSERFLEKTLVQLTGKNRAHCALDCGAGIGRVTKHLLLRKFDIVDMVELNQKFLDQARDEYLSGDKSQRVEKFICCGLQDFIPDANRYDVIWAQWVLGHLTDEHLMSFFTRCKAGLTENGVICVKENISQEGIDLDEEDSSVTRPEKVFLKLFRKSGLTVIREETQVGFPADIYKVKMYALK
ncbi:N-terminal Xaa-Pro-Lys N-methyltransferase 1-like [Saccoglossus kowalevskii]|uniref:Alpha N-terminal protein methyltransferase 1 n=1 Tax=Saccoglossus kowalevskii TaxID=10224 RepID=A0ABM0GK03_SACKO|nr:PREDICTED: N-terminal Xaa-Pro-Lys N-methyltransferase 1-like [Saccoglossus kowalevskii]